MDLHKNFKRTVLLIAISITWMFSFAQNHAVSGTVKDAAGEPLIGVSVQEKGTVNGTITDSNGNYSVSVGQRSTLVFSYIGYTAKEVAVGSLSTLNVTLEEDNALLDEVVVVGYGTMKRRDLTGSVASVTGEKLAANPVTNIVQALQGQLPGVTVTSQDGRPGATMSVRVRGGGSITQSNEPLFVVDGVQMNSIDDIPASNVESIDVLKDAASTAIYGARGANGVILVTTKQAKEGKPQVRYNVYYQAKQNPEVLDVLDAYDYVYWNWAYSSSYGETYGKNVAQYFGLGSANGNHLNEYKNVTSHNYINDLMRTANSWNHDLSLAGGNAGTKYYASLNYADDEGIRINSDFKRYNANFKVNQKITKTLSFDVDLRYAQMVIDGNNFGMATSVFGYRPIDNPLGDGDASHLGLGSGNVEVNRNPVDNINNYTNINNRQNINARGTLNWNILKGLTANTELSLRENWSTAKYWNAGDPNFTSYSEARLTKGDGYSVRWATTLNYDIQGLGKDHKASILLGHELLNSHSSSSVIDGYGYPEGFTMDNAFGMLNMTANSPLTGKDDPSKKLDSFNNIIGTPTKSVSGFGRANYAYKGRYLLTLTFRADGSSKFAPNHQWGYFPAAAAAWRISDEEFMESTKGWLDNLKLRLSIGTSGADNIDSGLWKEKWTTSVVPIDGQKIISYVPDDMMENRDLKWETTTSRNIGIDYGFFKNKLHGSLDLYWNTTSNILMRVPIDPTLGHSYQYQNVGQTSNKGVELALGWDIIRKKDWRLGVNLTYNYNHNNVDNLIDGVLVDTRTDWGSTMSKPAYDYIIRVGQPVGLIQGFKSAGFYTVNDFTYDPTSKIYTLKQGIPDTKKGDIANYSALMLSGFKLATGQNAFPGMAKFVDTDKNGIIEDADKTVIGKAMAEHSGGLTINAGYKNIDFSAGFIYQIGGSVYNANAMNGLMGNKDTGFGHNRLAFVKDCYQVYDIDNSGDIYLVTDPDALNAMNANSKYPLNFSEYGIVSSEFIEDASYLRLQNLTLGYTLPKSLMSKLHINSIRLYFTGTNLFCLNSYSGIDPDVNTQPGGVSGFPTPNYDYNSYPKARTYTFGLNVTF